MHCNAHAHRASARVVSLSRAPAPPTVWAGVREGSGVILQLDRTTQMATNEADRCLGCGSYTQPGNRRTLANFNVLLNTWRRIVQEKLDELKLEIDESNILGLGQLRDDGSTSKGFICTKCKRGFESYELSKKKLLDNASNALKYMATSQCSRKRPRQEKEAANVNPPPAKRMFRQVVPSTCSSPDVQVGDHIK